MPSGVAKNFIRNHHYSKSCHNGPSPCYGLYDSEVLLGVLCFATPCSEAVRSSVFGKGYKSHVIELHRLFIFDETPKNTESWFISRCLKLLKQDRPDIWAVVTFADSTEGHTGIIYKSTNAIFCGMTSKATFYLDEEGRLRHPRQNGVNITREKAITMGWTPVKRFSKYRYLYLLPKSKKEKRFLYGICRYTTSKVS
jgi:hypothetical protein